MTPLLIELIDLKLNEKWSPEQIVERKTRFAVSTRIDDKSAKTVTAATIALLKLFKSAVKTITADNGKEFAYP